jgi:predicted metal-dependent phosphoesterase TrpH
MGTARGPEADLHVHTTASDGTLTVDEVPEAARRAGVETVAITDHDRLHPALDAPVTTIDGVEVVRGVELRVDAGDIRVDLLGYAVRDDAALTAELDRLQADRIERARTIADRVERLVGVDLDIDPTDGVGRPHIARAIAASEAPYDYQAAFDRLIGSDCPCYVARDIPTFDEGHHLLDGACAVVSLAHPFRYPDTERALDLARELDAVERYYAYGRPVDTDRLDRLVDEAGLLRTGGSDAHDRTLGTAGLSGDEAAAFRDRLRR